jgi:hypothetical protein
MTLIGNQPPQQPWESLWDAVLAVREKPFYSGEYRSELQHNQGNNYTLKKEGNSVWVHVDEYVVYIRRTEGAATAEIYKITEPGRIDETEGPIDGAIALWSENKK